MTLESLLQSDEVIIIDVRTPTEFMGGHVANSINIPLHELPMRMHEFTELKKPVVLCCASGGRSAQAAYYLSQQGIAHCYNGGSWMDVNYVKNNRNL
ncbi:MAG: rhodanese-like domain-containing protein [Candidatus Competibacteraceae bacterium]|nr:rhodanese-like domain-containing protein [Candidatus Competibacteraceae bacterium]